LKTLTLDIICDISYFKRLIKSGYIFGIFFLFFFTRFGNKCNNRLDVNLEIVFALLTGNQYICWNFQLNGTERNGWIKACNVNHIIQ